MDDRHGRHVVLAFFFKVGSEFSRVWLATWYGSALLTLFGERLALSVLVRRWISQGRLNRRAVIVGGGPEAERLIAALEASHETDIRIVGIFDDRGDDRVSPIIAGYPKLGTVSELVNFARTSRIDLLIVSLPITAERRLAEFMKKLWVLPVDIRLSAHNNKLRFRPRTYSYIGNVPFIDISDKPIADWDYVTKWWFDKTVASVALLALAPLMALIAIAIKIDSKGPVLFKQKRQGFNNELIDVYKFRSMYVDQADADASKLVTKARPARRACRPPPAQDEPRRATAVLQMSSKATCRWSDRARMRSRPRPRRSSMPTCRRLFRAPPSEARRDGLGADQRLARRNGYRGEDPAARRAMTSIT